MFEFLLKFRYLAVVMVILALLDAVAYLVMGARIAFHAYAHLLDATSVTPVQNRPGLELLHSLDFVFVSLVMIVLALGIAKLFLLAPSSKSNGEPARLAAHREHRRAQGAALGDDPAPPCSSPGYPS